MSRESTEHASLVRLGANYIEVTYPHASDVETDTLAPLGSGLLLPSLRFHPDIVAWLGLHQAIIIGEAKTDDDLLRQHSRDQYRTFLEYCAFHGQESRLLLFCTWKVAPTARDHLRVTTTAMGLREDIWQVVSDVEMAVIRGPEDQAQEGA